MDLKPALIKKLSEMQKSLKPDEDDFRTLVTLKTRAEKETDAKVIAQMVMIVNNIIASIKTEEKKPAH